jgi:hypothetical protein
MSSTDRQNNLFINQDWKKIYQSFRNADFQSYDFDNLRRTMIQYLRTNYPEDFNDYIESSEYLALIDLIAFLGQSIAFRVDLNARENFLELAERRDSVLRLARLISYNAKRNIPAQGLLKFTTLQTTETVIDSNGRNLAGQVIGWNDPSNSNWYDQFIKVINAAFPASQQFGNPSSKATIYNIPTQQYRFSGNNTDVPVYGFSKTVAGNLMNFEITSTTFDTSAGYIYEEAPKVGISPACIYRDDGHGAGSAGSGFFFNFTQGTLNIGSFTVDQPTSNQSVDIDATNINNNDVWLYRLDQNGLENELWTQVSSVTGNNIIYNSLNKKIKNIYSVITRAGDAVSLAFSDGIFGNLPLGNFRTYYRVSNGLSYSINPGDIRNVTITIPYTSQTGSSETLSISLSLATTVSTAASTETNANVKANAPATYYTQNRMITGEDYNISPLAVTQQVAKVKAVNRASSGISRYFDLADPTGKYSSTNLFADDGVIYKDTYTNEVTFTYATRVDVEGIIINTILPILQQVELRNFYYDNFLKELNPGLVVAWYNITIDSTSTAGYMAPITPPLTPYKLGTAAPALSDLQYIVPGSLIKFTAPTGFYFDINNKNKLVATAKSNTTSYIWAEVQSITGDGTNVGSQGPVVLNAVVPDGARLAAIIPKLSTTIDNSIQATMIDLIFANKKFGLRYDAAGQSWKIIFEANINSTSLFSLAYQGSVASALDSSWLLIFTTDNEFYTITTRQQRYIFESDTQIRFYFDNNTKIYDSIVNKVIKDRINVLSINTRPDNSGFAFTRDLPWEVTSTISGLDGYVDNKKIAVSFVSSNNNGSVDNPQLFLDIVAPDNSTTYIIQQKYAISVGQEDYRYVSNLDNKVIIKTNDLAVGVLTNYADGQYFYFTSTGVVKQLNLATGKLIPSLDYKVYEGRDNLKFQYTHTADYESRIDPGVSNIMDIYVLTTDYDTVFRQWLSGASIDEPLAPSSDELYNTLSPSLNLIKSISDEIVYHPVSYRILFGSTAETSLQAIFKITKNISSVTSDNDIKSRAITAINQFFSLDNWNFGDTFYFTELSTYVMTQLTPDITNFVIVPRQGGVYFGGLFEIQCPSNQIFINGATVSDIEIISGITSGTIKSVTGSALTAVSSTQIITSANYGATNG